MERISVAEDIHGSVGSDPHYIDIPISPSSVGKVLSENSAFIETENGSFHRDTASQPVINSDGNGACVTLKRKRGRPRKTTNTSSVPQNFVLENTDSETFFTDKQSRTKDSLLSYDSTENLGEGETDSETKSKRKRRSKILDDFVADFNTSEEEDNCFLSSFPKFPSRGRGRGRGRRMEVLDPFDDDLFSSYISVFGKKFTVDELSGDSLLAGFNDDDLLPSSSSIAKSSTGSATKDYIENDGLEGVLGPDGNIKVKIENTGLTEEVDGERNFVYQIVVNSGSHKSITPLKIPITVNDSQGKETESQPSSSHIRTNESSQNISTSSSSSRQEVTPPRKEGKQVISPQVASLRQRYYRALKELRKRPRVYTLADLVYGASCFLSEDQLIFFTLQLKSGCNNAPAVRFSVREKMLALAFYVQSPGLYKWFRSLFHLPSKLILERWLEGIAKNDPNAAKKLMYSVYTRYVFRS